MLHLDGVVRRGGGKCDFDTFGAIHTAVFERAHYLTEYLPDLGRHPVGFAAVFAVEYQADAGHAVA